MRISTSFLKQIFTFLIVIVSMSFAHSQGVLPYVNDNFSGQIFLKIGLEPELVTTIGYIKPIKKDKENTLYTIGGAIKIAPLIVNHKAFKCNLFVTRDFTLNEKWHIQASPQIFYVQNTDRAATYQGIGFEAGSTVYHLGKKWTHGFDLALQNTTFTHIKLSKKAKETFDERYLSSNGQQPVDGWYESTATRFKIGYSTARQFNEHLGLQLSVGSSFIRQKQGILFGFAHAQLPFYFESALRYKL
jgi:hypothetical protein